MAALVNGATASLFVTNVLNGTVKAGGHIVAGGTVLRIDVEIPAGGAPPIETASTIIGSGFSERTDPAALVIGPTGVGLAADGTLYVADTLNSRIVAIGMRPKRMTDAGTGMTVAGGGALNGPLGLTIAPNGHIVTVNSNDGNMVETTPSGDQVAVKNVDVTGTGAGTLFGLAITANQKGVYFG
jgi:sugar lactone lactonase YvrE